VPAAKTETPLAAMDADLARAIERGEIDVHYQPIMRMRDGTVGGFEALLRWTHPEKGPIPPEEFIPRAEETGAISALGRFVLKRAAEDLARWQQFFPLKPPLFVNVNVSWRQLSEEAFFKDVEAILSRTAVAAGTLKLELTESAVMKDAEKAAAALTRLKKLGAGLAIDDFGTGTSALAQLGKFPFDTIKIDKSFLAGARNKRSDALLVSVVTLAHELKFEVIAEGVEREQDARQLRALAVEYAQGYIFGRALPAGEVTGFVAMTYAG
jgi:EAL domain-containing protein (putative c-di-GMP-specific phosphodiesterase class I)